ncbi:hypothetical protein H8356DRAFT_1435281 [Neocallimastix lanati (nom. inval.)]|nr:hypothetical protein H8356DRAFT_1435281 [Neocallimastix sp. JGI-2020a]
MKKYQKYLIENGADQNRKGYSPLFMTCLCGNENLEADLNKINKNKETPLFMAGKSRNENLVKYLIEEGAAIAIKNTHGADIYEVMDVINSSEKELPFFFLEIGKHGLTGKKEEIINYLVELKNINYMYAALPDDFIIESNRIIYYGKWNERVEHLKIYHSSLINNRVF